MKTVFLILLMITLSHSMHANAAIAPALNPGNQILILDEDLTPPVYIPGSPVRYDIPIYDAQTRQLITRASSICAYRLYTLLNGIPDAIPNHNNALE
jgi:hypothetical protein